MRHIIDFAADGGLIIALTDDGLLLSTIKEAPVEGTAEARWRPWELLPTLPQDGYDPDKTIAAVAADARAVAINMVVTNAVDEFRKLQADIMKGPAVPPRPVAYGAPPTGGPCANPNCALDAGHEGDCQRERPAPAAPAPEAPIEETPLTTEPPVSE